MRAVSSKTPALVVLLLLCCGAACSKKQANQNANPADAAQPPAQNSADGGDARALFDRGVDAYRHDRDEEAVEAFRQAVSLDPDFAEAHYRLGLALHAAGQADEADKAYERAVEAYEKLTKQDPKNSDAYYFLGLCYEKLGKYEQAVRVLKESVRNSPEGNDDKYYELGLAHYKIAQYDEAVSALNKALEINPDNFPAADLLEKAKEGASRVAEIRKHQADLLKQKNANANANANGGANSNGGSRSNRNDATSPSF